MPRNLSASRAHYEKAVRRLPLGVTSDFRNWGERTIYVRRGRGARLWDLDGNEYVDYRMGYGPNILGYADPRVDEAVREALDVGGVFALSTERELAVAERIARMVPAAELVRFSVSGTEAVMAALRLARAHTGRDSYVLVEGGYHGVFSEGLWQIDIENWRQGDGDPELVAYSAGVPGLYSHLIYSVPLNDANRLERLFKRHAGKIAALLIEPMMGNCCAITADAQYLKDVRALCDKYDVVMIMDEVKTGFRVARGGVQELMGVRADLCTFAKSMANGYPISALCGREDIMRRVGKGVVHGGTFTGHPVSLAAADRTLQILEDTATLENIAQYGRWLRDGLGQILSRRGIPHCFVGHPALSGLFFAPAPPKDYRDWVNTNYLFYDTLAPKLHELGVLVEPDSREPWFCCAAHDDPCLGATLSAFERAVDQTLDELKSPPREAVAN
ncbi:MAG: aminotransferase class III-fold pyridoxal phosphate-dependent enzyme [Gammaproteobacteria bacterium]|nr:aminotransferase class III-fold pyridoxal phosphate-dependent enzyme [Gammaproteobacteria bacterium]